MESNLPSVQGYEPDQQPIDWIITSLAFLFPALGGALFGYDIGATSGALVSIKSAATSGTDWCVLSPPHLCDSAPDHCSEAATGCRFQLTSFQSGLVVSLSLFGALAGSAAAFVVGDPIGRRNELLLAAALYCTWQVQASLPVWHSPACVLTKTSSPWQVLRQ